jgi:hypothetical protein
LLRLSGSFYLAFSPLVREDQRAEWEEYSVKNQGWLQEGMDDSISDGETDQILPFIWKFGEDRAPERVNSTIGPNNVYSPFWQVAPPFPSSVNQDSFHIPGWPEVFEAMTKADTIVLSEAAIFGGPADDPFRWPQSFISAPIHETLERGSAVLPWHNYFYNIIPPGVCCLSVVVKNTCHQVFTYTVSGQNVAYVGPEDLHDRRYSHMDLSADFDALEELNGTDTCRYSLYVYPTQEFHETYTTDEPFRYTTTAVLIFVLTSTIFIVYDCLVRRKDNKVMDTAVNSTAIVTSLFPAQVRDRLIEDAVRRRNVAGKGNMKKRREASRL